jgi:hypothetical protein
MVIPVHRSPIWERNTKMQCILRKTESKNGEYAAADEKEGRGGGGSSEASYLPRGHQTDLRKTKASTHKC